MNRVRLALLLCLLVLPAGAGARDLEVAAEIGPWPTVANMIAYRGRIWFANAVRYPDHNSADLYSYDPANGDLRFERHIFSQDIGRPMVWNGLLYWPYEDPRVSATWGHIAVTDGDSWRLLTVAGERPAYHTFALAHLGDRLYAASSAWRATIDLSLDRGATWRNLYDRPTPPRRVSRITDLETVGENLFGAAVDRLDGGAHYSLLMLSGEQMVPVPGWPAGRRVFDLTAWRGRLYAILGANRGRQIWRTDGLTSERVGVSRAPALIAIAGNDVALWAVGAGALWSSDDGARWRKIQDLAGGRPDDLTVVGPEVYVGGGGKDGNGVFWSAGPTGAAQPEPRARAPIWPAATSDAAVDWPGERASLDNMLTDPALKGRDLRTRLYRLASAGPPPEFLSRLLEPPLPRTQFKTARGNLAPVSRILEWLVPWSMAVAGSGRIPAATLSQPWDEEPNEREKYFNPLSAALFAVTWTGQSDRETIDILIARAGNDTDPLWLRGDVMGTLNAITGQRFAYDAEAWRAWWREARQTWP